MNVKIVRRIGSSLVEFVSSGQELFEAVAGLPELPDIPHCANCKSDSLEIRALKPKGYEYVKVICRECGTNLTFGKTKDDGRYYIRKNEDGSLQWERAYKERREEFPSHETPPVGNRGAARRETTAKKEDDLPF